MYQTISTEVDHTAPETTVWSMLAPEPWVADALCAQSNPDDFFANKSAWAATREAKKLCAKCDVREQCLAYAMRNRERWGVWGGLSETERRKLRKGKKS